MPNTDDHQNDSISMATTAIGSASSSTAPSLKAPPPRALSTSPNFLSVPSTSLRARRPSRDSAFSELSELSIYPDEVYRGQHRNRLLPDSNRDEHHRPKSRFHHDVSAFYIRNYGVLLVLLAMFFGSGMNIGTRLLETPGPHGEPMHPFQILFVRQSITVACCTTYAFITGRIPDFPFGPRPVRWLLVIRGLTGFFGVFGMYFSLLYLPLAEATVLTFLAPILTCYACSWLTPGEPFTRQQQFAGLISLIGVVFIAEPASFFTSSSSPPPSSETNKSASGPAAPTPHQHLLAIAIAMLGVLGSTGAMTAIRAIGTRAHPFLSINYFSVWCSIVSLACLVIFPDVKFRLPGNLLEWAILAMLGGCGFIMQFLLTAGLAYGGVDGREEEQAAHKKSVHSSGEIDLEDLVVAGGGPSNKTSRRPARQSSVTKGSQNRATSMTYTQMLFALLGDKLVFGVTPGTTSWIGSGLVLAGAIWVAAARDQGQSQQQGQENALNRRTGMGLGTASELGGMEAALPLAKSVSRGSERERGRESGTREEAVGLMSGIGDEAVELEELGLGKERSRASAGD